MDSFVLSRSMP